MPDGSSELRIARFKNATPAATDGGHATSAWLRLQENQEIQVELIVIPRIEAGVAGDMDQLLERVGELCDS